MRGLILLAAVIVWVNVYAGTSHPQTLQSPIIIQNLSSGLAVVDPVTEVTVDISGTPHELGMVNTETLNFSIDLSNIKFPGKYSADINVSQIPEGVKLMKVNPQKIVFDVDFEREKIVPVVINTSGWVADNFSVKSVEVVPNRVTIHGAERSLAQISDVKASVSIDGRYKSFSAPVKYYVETAAGVANHSVRVTPGSGTASVEIDKGTSFRNLGLKATYSGELPGGFWVQEVAFEPRTLMVRGTQGKLDQLDYLLTTPIDLKNKIDGFKTQVGAILPEGVEVVGENLIYTTVTIESSEDSRSLAIVPIYANVTEGFTVANVTPASVRVVVVGNPEVLKRLSRNQISMNVDLQGALSGANILEITLDMFDADEGLSVVSFEPDTIEVILSRLE